MCIRDRGWSRVFAGGPNDEIAEAVEAKNKAATGFDEILTLFAQVTAQPLAVGLLTAQGLPVAEGEDTALVFGLLGNQTVKNLSLASALVGFDGDGARRVAQATGEEIGGEVARVECGFLALKRYRRLAQDFFFIRRLNVGMRIFGVIAGLLRGRRGRQALSLKICAFNAPLSDMWCTNIAQFS